jgi:hypothetical protein
VAANATARARPVCHAHPLVFSVTAYVEKKNRQNAGGRAGVVGQGENKRPDRKEETVVFLWPLRDLQTAVYRNTE